MNEVDWIGELPGSWKLSTIGRMATLRGGGTPASTSGEYWDGTEGTRWLAIADMGDVQAGAEHRGRFLTSAGLSASRLKPSRRDTVLFAMYASVGTVAFLHDPAVWNQAIVGLEARQQDADARYLYWLMVALKPTLPFHYRSNTQDNLNAEQVRSFVVPQPTLDEQRAIADYLDRETAQVDAFIAKNEELIALLTERRAAVAQVEVEHHVGIGSRLRYRFQELDVRARGRWEEMVLLSVSIHHGVALREDDTEDSGERGDLSHYKVASRGDIVLNRMRAFQGGLGVAPCTGLVSPDYAVLRPSAGVDAQWLSFVMRTPRFIGEMAMRLRGIGSTDSGAVRTPRIGVADLGMILVDVPLPVAQRSELQAVQEAVARAESALEIAQRSIELARERRAALISAAVTGKIEVASVGNTAGAGQLTAS